MQINNFHNEIEIALRNQEANNLIQVLNILYGGNREKGMAKLCNKAKKRLYAKQKSDDNHRLKILDLKEKADLYLNWKILIDRVQKDYKSYLKSLASDNEEIKIKFLIVSEAPLLDLSDISNPSCNYLLGGSNSEESTIYRSVPYHALKKLRNSVYNKTSTKVEIKDFRSCLLEEGVAFIDLIEFPLPLISSAQRRLWSESSDFSVHENTPLTFTLFKFAFERLITSLEPNAVKLDPDLKVVLMMPPNTAMGIVGHLGKNFDNVKNDLPYKLKTFAKHIIRPFDPDSNNVFQPEVNPSFRQFRQIAINSSNNPSLNAFLHALK